MVKSRYHEDIPEKIKEGSDATHEWMPPDTDYLSLFGFGGPPCMDMDKPLILQVSMTGFFIRKQDNPNQPISPEEIANDAIKAIKAGCSMFHIHAKHTQDGSPCHDPKAYKKIADLVWDEYPEAVVTLCPLGNIAAPNFLEVIRPLLEPLLEYEEKTGGKRKYGGHITMTHMDSMDFPGSHTLTATFDALEIACKWQEERGIKPSCECWNAYTTQKVKKRLIDSGILTPPALIGINFGKEASGMSLTPEKSLWLYREFLNWLEIVPRDNVVLKCNVGGHNWLPLTALAIAAGVDVIGVGMEDVMFRYPHKNDMIKESADCIRAITKIAEAFGREIATPKQAKEILGLEKISFRGAFEGPL